MHESYKKIETDKFYDDLSKMWDKTRPGYTKEIFGKIKSCLHRNNPRAILDFGCGTGLLCKYLHGNMPDVKIDGIDISGQMIEKAKANCPECNFYAGNILSARLPNYDAIVSKDVFNHIEDIPKTISRLNELLNKGGKIAIANRERGEGVKDKIIDALRLLGFGTSIEYFSFKPTKEDVDSFMAEFPAFKDEHKAFIRKKLEESGEYYIIFANKTG